MEQLKLFISQQKGVAEKLLRALLRYISLNFLQKQSFRK